MKKITTLFVFTASLLSGRAQQSLHLAGVAGTTLTAGGYSLNFSVGETVITPSPSATFSPFSNAWLVTIGFQQPQVSKTGALVHYDNWVSAYPNPAVNNVRLDIHGDNFQVNEVHITDVLGRSVIAPFVLLNGSVDLKIDRLAAGTYIVAVTDKSTGNTVATKIIKQP